MTPRPLRPRGKPFPKGKSGNPRGRTIGSAVIPYDVREACRALAPECVQVLRDLLAHKDARFRAIGATALLDRGFGRPAQALTGANGGPIILTVERPNLTQLTDEELDQLEALQRKIPVAALPAPGDAGGDTGGAGEA